MPYTFISRTKSAAACIDYMRGHGHGHNDAEVRNQFVTGVNMLPDSAVPFEVQMGWNLRNKNSRNKTEAYRVFQSFGPKELSADSPDDVMLAHMIGCEFAKTMWPGHQVAVYTQTDGKGHKVHNHFVVCNANMESGKAVDNNSVLHAHVKEASDKICGQFFEIQDFDKAATKDKVTRTERAKREINAELKKHGKKPTEYIWKDDLKKRILDAKSVATDMDTFYQELVKRGVEMEIKKPTKRSPEGGIVYQLVDLTGFDEPPGNTNKLRARGSRLGTDYDIPSVTQQLEKNAKEKAEKEKPQLSFEERMALFDAAVEQRKAAEKAAKLKAQQELAERGRKLMPQFIAEYEAKHGKGSWDRVGEPVAETEKEQIDVVQNESDPVPDPVSDVVEPEAETITEEPIKKAQNAPQEAVQNAAEEAPFPVVLSVPDEELTDAVNHTEGILPQKSVPMPESVAKARMTEIIKQVSGVEFTGSTQEDADRRLNNNFLKWRRGEQKKGAKYPRYFERTDDGQIVLYEARLQEQAAAYGIFVVNFVRALEEKKQREKEAAAEAERQKAAQLAKIHAERERMKRMRALSDDMDVIDFTKKEDDEFGKG